MIRPYREDADSSFTFGTDHIPSARYNLNKLFKLTHNRPSVQLPVRDLKWILDYDTPNKERLEKADVGVPLLVVKEAGRYYTVDGLHRLSKAVGMGITKVPAKVITLSEMYSAKVIEDKPKIADW